MLSFGKEIGQSAVFGRVVEEVCFCGRPWNNHDISHKRRPISSRRDFLTFPNPGRVGQEKQDDHVFYVIKCESTHLLSSLYLLCTKPL